jgi:hypothetical protein
MATQFRYQHYRSIAPDVEPSVTELREGEIAVNLYAGKERMFIKNTNDQIVKFISDGQIENKLTNYASKVHTHDVDDINNFDGAVVNTIKEEIANNNTEIINSIDKVIEKYIYGDDTPSSSDTVVTTNNLEETLAEYATKGYVSGYTYDKNSIDRKIEESSTFDPSQYYNKTDSDSRFQAKGNYALSSHTHSSNDITDFETAVGNSVKNNTTVKNEIISAVTASTEFTTINNNVNTISGNVTTISGNVNTISGNVVTISGDVRTISGNVNTISGNVITISGDVNTLKQEMSSHTHASSAVTSMRGYSKASAAAAITTGDSLNVAIGKLEKGIEAAASSGVNTVKLGSGSTNGNITLTVNGTLQDTVYVPGLGGAAFLETGTTTSTVARGEHNHVANDITDFSSSVENVVESSTTVTNRIKNVIASAITSNTNVTSAITNVISSNTAVTSAVTNVVSAFTYDKNYIDNQISSHTHTSSAVTSMRGYSKPSATSAIATGDTLNQAIGKLEKKVDDAVAGGVSSVALGSGSTNGTVTLSVNGTLQNTIYVPGLGGAAFMETGITTTTVARGKHSHAASDITDFNEAVSGAVKNSTDVKNEIISAVTSSTAFTTVSGVAYSAYSVTEFITGHNTVNTLANLPKTKRLVIATIGSSSNNLSVSGGTLTDGYELHVIVRNSSGSNITITFPSTGNYVAVVPSIDIEGGKYGEINIISDGTKLYVRGA